ncbi:SGNH/GDSL hydrolase family protein [Peribacillus sp. SCS-26]|uniref:SGNH/GDSL hydrolase family protein n=1 Tax=Paraperibacillus marinus TaxID=3115295 RepID=UPI0039059E6A
MNVKKKGLRFAAAAVLLACLPFSAAAKTVKLDDSPFTVRYVALGDSLAAGQTPYKYVDYGYPDYLAEAFDGKRYKLKEFDNYGIPGYTSENVKNDVVKSKKIREDIKDATHLTIDIGANDLLPKLKTDPAGAIMTAAANLEIILKTIDSLNSRVQVYVMGYFNPYPSMPAEEQARLLPILQKLNEVIKTAVSKNKDTYVPTDALIAATALEYIPNPADIHLSEAGYKAVAAEFWKVMDKKKK